MRCANWPKRNGKIMNAKTAARWTVVITETWTTSKNTKKKLLCNCIPLVGVNKARANRIKTFLSSTPPQLKKVPSFVYITDLEISATVLTDLCVLLLHEGHKSKWWSIELESLRGIRYFEFKVRHLSVYHRILQRDLRLPKHRGDGSQAKEHEDFFLRESGGFWRNFGKMSENFPKEYPKYLVIPGNVSKGWK